MLSKVKWIIGLLLAGAGIVISAFLSGASSANNKIKVKSKEVTLKAYKALTKQREQSQKLTEENDEKTNNDDWSGFNR